MPSAALRFSPPEAVRASARAAQRDSTAADSTAAPEPRLTAGLAEVWLPTGTMDGPLPRLRPVLVRVLGTDGTQTAIAPVDAAERAVVKRGMEVVTRMEAPGGFNG